METATQRVLTAVAATATPFSRMGALSANCVNSDPNFGNFIALPSPSLLPRPSSPIPYAGSPYSIPNFDEEQVFDHLLETQVENDMNFRHCMNFLISHINIISIL